MFTGKSNMNIHT